MHRLNLYSALKTLQGGNSSRPCGGFLERYIGGFQHQCGFTRTHIFGKSTPTTRAQVPEYLITGLKLRDVFAYYLYSPRNISSKKDIFGFEQSRCQAEQPGCASEVMPVTGIHGCGMNLDEYFIVLRGRFFDLFELNDIR